MEEKYLTKRGDLDKLVFKTENDEFGNLEKGQGSTCVVATTVVMTTRLGMEEKAAVGGCKGEVMKEPHYVLPVLELKGMMIDGCDGDE